MSVFQPNSPQAAAISANFAIALWLSAAILALVVGLVVTLLVRHRRRREDEPDPDPVYGNTPLEIGWTAAPLVICLGLFALALATMGTAGPAPVPGREPDLVVVGHQWWWEARYPAAGVVAANEIHIPTGRDLLVRVESADVIHDFWVAQLGPKVDAVPGHPNHTWIRADEAGTFAGACAEFCGTQHAWMLFDIVAEEPAAYAAWLARQGRTPPPPAGPREQEGARLFMEQTCRNCHAIAGTGAVATVGPDLTHVASRARIGAGVVANDRQAMFDWLKDPGRAKPGSHMPNFQLTDGQAEALTAYLETLR